MSEGNSKKKPDDLQSNQNISQRIEANDGPVQSVNALGNAYAEQSNYYGTFIFNSPSYLLDSDLPKLNGFNRLINYVKGILFLTSVLLSWLFLGIFAHDAFPFDQVLEIFLACFKAGPKRGTEDIWNNISKKQLSLRSLQEYDLKPKNFGYLEASRLNKLESEYWLIKKLIRILSEGSADKDKRIASALESLEEREDYLKDIAEPLKTRFFPVLTKIQSAWDSVYPSKSENDVRLNHFIASLIQEFKSTNGHAKSREVDELLSAILDEIEVNNIGVSGVQRKTLDRFLELLEWVADKEIDQSRNDYLSGQREITKVIESGQILGIQERKKFHFNSRCTYLRSLRHSLSEQLGDSDKIKIFSNISEAKENGFSACGHCQRYQKRYQSKENT